MKDELLYYFRVFGKCLVFLLGPTAIWCALAGAIGSIACRLFSASPSAADLATLIVFGPTPLLLVLGVILAYFSYMHEFWSQNERATVDQFSAESEKK